MDYLKYYKMNQTNQNNFNLLQQLPQIISESGGIGTFELDIFKLDITNNDGDYICELECCKY